MTKFEKWLYLLKFSELYQDRLAPIPDALKTEEEIVMAIEAYRHAVADNYVKELIDFRRKASIDEASRLEEARRDAEARGEARGEAKGEIKGKIEMARQMLHDGVDINTVIKYSGLPEEEIRKLIN